MKRISRVALALAIVIVAGALLWIAAINMIDSTIIVEGRVVDPRGRAVVGAEVTLQVGNRTIRGWTKADGKFFVAATTTFLKHECVLRVGSEKRTLVAPGRHHLEITIAEHSSLLPARGERIRVSAACSQPGASPSPWPSPPPGGGEGTEVCDLRVGCSERTPFAHVRT